MKQKCCLSNHSLKYLLDLSKAFHCISHDLLLNIMNNNSIIGKELQLLLSYLYEQKHMVAIGQE